MPLVNVTEVEAQPCLPHEMLAEVRDVGGRMMHLLATYDRLVQGLLGADVPNPDPYGRLQSIGRQIEEVTRRVQEMLLVAHEERRVEVDAAFERASRLQGSSRLGLIASSGPKGPGPGRAQAAGPRRARARRQPAA